MFRWTKKARSPKYGWTPQEHEIKVTSLTCLVEGALIKDVYHVCCYENGATRTRESGGEQQKSVSDCGKLNSSTEVVREKTEVLNRFI